MLKKISQLEGIHKSISTAWELSHLKILDEYRIGLKFGLSFIDVAVWRVPERFSGFCHASTAPKFSLEKRPTYAERTSAINFDLTETWKFQRYNIGILVCWTIQVPFL